MSSYTQLVNRQHPLAPDYIPLDLTEPEIPFLASSGDPKRLLRARAAQAVEELFQRARHTGLSLHGISGYRSYKRQTDLYQQSDSGYVAPPGCSEHQTGLALDVSCPAVHYELEEAFALTREYKFLEDYGPMYGFIIRYPRGKEKITGYAWEPWHIRYVTKTLALYLSLTNLTLDEYYQL
ncbi:MAG: M15 family metallopeptidase [Lachnospiraceae bacterium]|nr:M15 family metallopeptidase [Lachnospiraceae bacterium]